jgi:hypothetical protein
MVVSAVLVRVGAKHTAPQPIMVASRSRGCHFGDKCGRMRSTRHSPDETGRSAPGASAD